MAYSSLLTNIQNYADDVRTMVGCDVEDLGDTEISSFGILGSAETVILERLPDAASITDAAQLRYLTLALLNLLAFYAWPAVRLRVLQKDEDGKTAGTRFSKAIELTDPAKWEADAYKWLKRVASPSTTPERVSQLSTVSPSEDIFREYAV